MKEKVKGSLSRDDIIAIRKMTETEGWAVVSSKLQETLVYVENIILNGMVPEGEMMSYIARRWFLRYFLALPQDCMKSFSALFGSTMTGSSASNKAVVEKFNLL